MSNASDQAKFLAGLQLIADTGPSMIGNLWFRRNVLEWANEARYWRCHAALLSAGSIVQGRGRGGTVGIAPPARKRRAA